MSTLRREMRKKFEEIIFNNFSRVGADYGVEDMAEELVDVAMKMLGDEKKPKFDVKQSDPAWALFHGETPDNSRLLFEKEAFDAFERDMQTPDNWFWFPAKTSDEKVWKYFREFVVRVYTFDRKAFEKYQTWRTQPFARGAMSNLAIKKNPENFPASWSDFLSATRSNQPSLRPVETDDNGAPISY